MGVYRALLIGASDYEARGVAPLPFIPGDLARLGAALRERGFQDVQILSGREGGKQVTANYVNARVTGFLRRARSGDTLLIVLSGHGIHASGRDYLVPEDIDEDTHPFASGCVAIDWHHHLDETRAGHVVFLIDACREGIEQDHMGVEGVRQWGRQKVGAALRRKVAYVYGCSPAQLALFVRADDSAAEGAGLGVPPGESFSLFSRAVFDVLRLWPGDSPMSLGDFKDAVQSRIEELHRAYRKRGAPQTLRIVTDLPAETFFFLPDAQDHRPTRPARTPSSPGPARKRGSMRFAVLLTSLAVIATSATTAWVLASTLKDNDSRGSRSAGVGSQDPPALSHPAEVSEQKAPSPQPKKSSGSPTGAERSRPGTQVTGTPQEAGKASTSPPDCPPSATRLTVRSVRNSYRPTESPTFEITARNVSSVACTFDFGSASTTLTISAAAPSGMFWSSADCPAGNSILKELVPARDSVSHTVEWNRTPSIPQCGTPTPNEPAVAGTYLVTVVSPGVPQAHDSFVLTQDQRHTDSSLS
ncbi:caspase family protein [Streptomyces achromogenes]|uniref:caspase family protein n=1 Tax=Streptomyces achromogenes TaxID=67255 RepID=UPI0037018A7A